MNEYRRFGSLSSSVDPMKLALTVQGIINVLGGALVTFGVLTVADQTTITDGVNTIVTQAAIFMPAAYTAYGAVQTIAGIVRKIFVAAHDKFGAFSD